MLHTLVRWGLALHGGFHAIEFAINLYEGAFLSALFTLLTALLMLGGAFIDYTHHRKDNMPTLRKTTKEAIQHIIEEENTFNSNKVLWGPCAIAFDFNPSTLVNEMDIKDQDIKPGDLFFEPGFYMFNDHTVLNWKTQTPVFDFVYLIMAEGSRCKEDGTPKLPELYRMCDKGVVVRKLSLLDEDGNERPSYRNYNNDVFVVAAPDGVRINGYEFHFQLPQEQK